MMDNAPAMEEPPVLRIIPNCSLSEPAMLQLLDTLEIRAQMDGAQAFFAQFVYAESDRFPSLLTQYPTMEDTDKIMSFAALKEPLTVQDPQISGEQTTKQVLIKVLREEDQEAIQQALAPTSTFIGRGGATRRTPSTLLIIREWGIISMTTDKEKHLAELATCTRDGFRIATPDQTIELAEPLATLMTPRINGTGTKRITAVGIWFTGKLIPPANGLMRVGRGFIQSGVRTVGLSPHPISFAPLRGARQHSALSMPGWRYDRDKDCMVTRLENTGREPRGPMPSSTSPDQSASDHAGGRGFRPARGYGSSRSREVILSIGLERENFLRESTMGTDGELFLAQEQKFAQEYGVPIDQICPFAVKYKIQGKLDFICRVTKGCYHPDRQDMARLPCYLANSRPITNSTFSIAGPGPVVTTPVSGFSAPSSSSAALPSALVPVSLDHAGGFGPTVTTQPPLAESPLAVTLPETSALEAIASSGAPAEAPAPGAASQDAFDAQFGRAATFLDNIEPLMRMERATLETAASEEPATGDLDSVSQVLSNAPVMTTEPTTAPYVPLTATLGDVFGHIDVAIGALGRLAPTSVLLDPEIRSNLASLATPELCLQAASDYLTRLRAECREANSKKRPLTRASAGASSDASRDASPAPPAKK